MSPGKPLSEYGTQFSQITSLATIAPAGTIDLLGSYKLPSPSVASEISYSDSESFVETAVETREDLRTKQMEKRFQSDGDEFLMVSQWSIAKQTEEPDDKTMSFWAVVSRLDANGHPERENLTVQCWCESDLGARPWTFYGRGISLPVEDVLLFTLPPYRSRGDCSLEFQVVTQELKMSEGMLRLLGGKRSVARSFAVALGEVLPDFEEMAKIQEEIGCAVDAGIEGMNLLP